MHGFCMNDPTDLLTETALLLLKQTAAEHSARTLAPLMHVLPELMRRVNPLAHNDGESVLSLLAGIRMGNPSTNARASCPSEWPDWHGGAEEPAAEAWPTDQERFLAILTARGADPFVGWGGNDDTADRACPFSRAFRNGLEAWCGRVLERPDAPKGTDLMKRAWLHQAAHADRPALIVALLNAGYAVDHRHTNGRTALSYATSPRTAQQLMEAGAQLDSVDDRGCSVLEHWAKLDDPAHSLMKGVIDRLDNPRHRNTAERRALREAAFAGKRAEVSRLLQTGIRDERALAWACAGSLNIPGGNEVRLGGIRAVLQGSGPHSPQDAALVQLLLQYMEHRPHGLQATEQLKLLRDGHADWLATAPVVPEHETLMAWWRSLAGLTEPPERWVQALVREQTERIERRTAGVPPLNANTVMAVAHIVGAFGLFDRHVRDFGTLLRWSHPSLLTVPLTDEAGRTLVHTLLRQEPLSIDLVDWIPWLADELRRRPALLGDPDDRRILGEHANDTERMGELARSWASAVLDGTTPASASRVRNRM